MPTGSSLPKMRIAEKRVVAKSKKFEPTLSTVRGSVWAHYAANKRALFVERAFRYWRGAGFPYYRLTRRQVALEFSRLLEKDWKQVFDGDLLRCSNAGLRLA